ncbi:hypothetical protein [Methylibium sp. T29]|uniref:hypothetical protein n=1 Tax=Methylibium sp. T29 TaxID=1430884 RepID=UPI0012696B2D|nr:hypothetical protein [Methylibium sp. T29]
MHSLEWENRFQFTDTGEQPYEIGLLIEVERERESSEGYELRYGPLLQASWGAVQGNLNLLFERRLHADDGHTPTEFGYQWQVRVHSDSALDWGARASGTWGAGTTGRRDRSNRTSSARRCSPSSATTTRTRKWRPACCSAPVGRRPAPRCVCRPWCPSEARRASRIRAHSSGPLTARRRCASRTKPMTPPLRGPAPPTRHR